MKTYIEFLTLYKYNYPENLIVLIGEKEDSGVSIGDQLVTGSAGKISHLCILKGGIDAIKTERPELLRKGASQQTE